MPPNPFSQSLAPTNAHTRFTAIASAQQTLYHRPPAPIPIQRTERDILISHHQFLRDDSVACDTDTQDTRKASEASTSTHENNNTRKANNSTSTTSTYETTLTSTYDSTLYKEYVLISLSHYKSGKVAMRWRIETEVKTGKGSEICAELECSRKQEVEREVLFCYREFGEEKEALVKINTEEEEEVGSEGGGQVDPGADHQGDEGKEVPADEGKQVPADEGKEVPANEGSGMMNPEEKTPIG
ncbi:folate-sensitive fragile site protein Fra10Ac1-domain-containing protein [Pyronema omphalodes]|nr:folate-sensitive fragile site protein Fra10Ac1-domain-containing protein [Pyronema omphalodes]